MYTVTYFVEINLLTFDTDKLEQAFQKLFFLDIPHGNLWKSGRPLFL